MKKLKYVKFYEEFQVNEEFMNLFKNKEKEQQDKQENDKKEQFKDKIENVFPGYTKDLNDIEIGKLYMMINTVCYYDDNIQTRESFFNFFEKLNEVLVKREKGEEPKDIEEISKLDEKYFYHFYKLIELIQNGFFLDKQGNKNVIKTFTIGNAKVSFEYLMKFFKKSVDITYAGTALLCLEKLSKLSSNPFNEIDRIWIYRKK